MWGPADIPGPFPDLLLVYREGGRTDPGLGKYILLLPELEVRESGGEVV